MNANNVAPTSKRNTVMATQEQDAISERIRDLDIHRFRSHHQAMLFLWTFSVGDHCTRGAGLYRNSIGTF